jgi:hypothetical protein
MNIVTEFLRNKNNIGICIFPSDVLQHKELEKMMTEYTLFYCLRFKSIADKIDIVFADSIDKGLDKYQNYDHLLFMAAGVRIYDSSILLDVDNLINSNPYYMVAGHVLHWGDDWYEMHHQFFLVNMKNWKTANCPKFGGWHPDVDRLPVILRSEENFHDDYTPLWVKPNGDMADTYHSKQGWNIIAQSMVFGFQVISWDAEIRNKRTYYYPETNSETFYSCLKERKHDSKITNPNQRKLINEVIGLKNQVWILNSEDMDIKAKNRKWDRIVLPASGFKFLEAYRADAFNGLTKLIIYDFNQTSLDWIKHIYESSSEDLRHIVASFSNNKELKWFGINNPDVLTPMGQFSNKFEKDLRKTINYFGGDSKFWELIQRFRNSEVIFIKTDLIEDRQELLELIGEHSCLFHISNIFATDFLAARMGLSAMQKNFTEFCESVNKNTKIVGLSPYNEALGYD